MKEFSTIKVMTSLRLFTFVTLVSLGLFSCREELPVNGGGTSPFRFRLTPGTWFSFDNWKLDMYGQKVGRSYFRNSWTVTDTGVTLNGMMPVTVLIDSTFDTTGVFVRSDTLLFHTSEAGDVYQWGFLSARIAERESLQLTPQWDRIAAFSQPLGSSWRIATIDTSMGAPQNEFVYGRIGTSSGYVGPILINGEERTILSYRVEITKPRLYYAFWITDFPGSIARSLDDSDVLRNAELRELKVILAPR